MAPTYRFMTPADRDELGALARRIWNGHYRSIITQAQIDYMLAKSYSAQSLGQQLADGHRFLLLCEETDIKGFISVHGLRHVVDPLLRGESAADGDYFLHKFYLAAEVRGQGYGKALLGELLRQMPEIARLRLQVARKNTNSWKFYQKQGFTIVAEADFAIGNGHVMEDYVMEKWVNPHRTQKKGAEWCLFSIERFN